MWASPWTVNLLLVLCAVAATHGRAWRLARARGALLLLLLACADATVLLHLAGALRDGAPDGAPELAAPAEPPAYA